MAGPGVHDGMPGPRRARVGPGHRQPGPQNPTQPPSQGTNACEKSSISIAASSNS